MLLERSRQINLKKLYKKLHQKNIIPSFSTVEFKCQSQNTEDGILLFIFSIIKTTNKKVVEVTFFFNLFLDCCW
jgi:hypothetical protein